MGGRLLSGLNRVYVIAEETTDNLASSARRGILALRPRRGTEASGSDAVTALSAVAARTHRIGQDQLR